ncbi:MAG: ABC transporter permease, partial [bacterium]
AANGASAAILALTVTLGSWALDYAAAARGGVLQTLASYTPSAALRVFEQGELRASIVLIMLLIGAGGLAVSAEWLRTGRSRWRRCAGVAAVGVIVAAGAFTSTRIRASYDLSEDRRNSFASADAAALDRIHSPLLITVYLAAEDPRLADLERGIFAKLRRRMADVRITYAAKGRSGLFERPSDHYGEVWYAIGDRRGMSRSATEEIVLETIYDVAGIPPPTAREAAAYPGYPLTQQPRNAALVFFLLWPLAVTSAWWGARALLS